jgi:hypothetical protein
MEHAAEHCVAHQKEGTRRFVNEGWSRGALPGARLGGESGHALALRGERECAQDLTLLTSRPVVSAQRGSQLQQPTLRPVAHLCDLPICPQHMHSSKSASTNSFCTINCSQCTMQSACICAPN